MLPGGSLAPPAASGVCFAKRTLYDMKSPTENRPEPVQETAASSDAEGDPIRPRDSDHLSTDPPTRVLIPAFESALAPASHDARARFAEACAAWLSRSASLETRAAYARELGEFLRFAGIPPSHLEKLAAIRPHEVAAWRDGLRARGLANTTVVRKMTVLRSLFGYLQVYGYCGANPAHSDFVEAPAVPRDGKTVGLATEDCRRLLDAPVRTTPLGVRDRALLAVLAYTGCRVGELVRLRVRDYKTSGAHRILAIQGKGGKERSVPLHPEAVERLEGWLEVGSIREGGAAALFPPPRTARGRGRDGFRAKSLTRRAVQHLVGRYVEALRLDPAVTVHSLRVTALTTARERGADILDLRDFAGHSDPRTTLTYVRSRDRLSKSPAYVLKY